MTTLAVILLSSSVAWSAPVPGTRDGIVPSEAPRVETRKIDPDQEFHGTLALNLLWIVVWPLVPLAIGVDLIAGNAGKHSPKPLRLGLVPFADPRP
jgi:hypothetical protein